MEQELGSIMKYCYDRHPCQVYIKELPQGFKIPSLFFPPPFNFDSPDTTTSYKVSYSLPIKVFGLDSHDASQRANGIADEIRNKRNLIPMVDPDGNPTGQYIRLNKCEVKSIDKGVFQILLTWDSRYRYEKETYQKMGRLFINEKTKGG